MGQRVAIYCRVSTADQSCERQESELLAFAERAGYQVVGIYKEVASGAKNDRTVRKQVLALAQARQIDAVVITAAMAQEPRSRMRTRLGSQAGG